ncbi:MAG: LacI family DNA-binding transcriptional regulator [Bacteroidota bacterium]
MNSRIRIIDIAKKAGVSKGTVDRVIHKRGNVSPDAREKVMAAMQELDYQPNVIASALAYNRQWKIAALLPEHQNDPFWEQPKAGIDRAIKSLRDYGVSVEKFDFRDGDEGHFQEMGQSILAGGFDAVLVAPIFLSEGHQFLDKCAQQKIPYLQINTYLERNDDAFLCYIGQDSYQSGLLAAKLLNFGMSPGEQAMILHLEQEVYNSKHLVEKERGFEEFFQRHRQKKIEVVKSTYEDVFDKNELRIFLEKKFKDSPNIKGLFVTTSKIFHVVDLLSEMGQQDVKLVGFDLIEENLEHLKKDRISFLINQNPFKQGFLGIMNIFNHLIIKKEPARIQYLPLDVVMLENLPYYLEQGEELHLVI